MGGPGSGGRQGRQPGAKGREKVKVPYKRYGKEKKLKRDLKKEAKRIAKAAKQFKLVTIKVPQSSKMQREFIQDEYF